MCSDSVIPCYVCGEEQRCGISLRCVKWKVVSVYKQTCIVAETVKAIGTRTLKHRQKDIQVYVTL